MITKAHEKWENESFEAAIEAQKIFEEGIESSDVGYKRSRKEIGYQVLTQARHYRTFAGGAATDSTQEAIDEASRLMTLLEGNIALTPDPMREAIRKAAPDYPFADDKLSAESFLRKEMKPSASEASGVHISENGRVYQDGEVLHGILVKDEKDLFVLSVSRESPEYDNLKRSTWHVQFDNFAQAKYFLGGALGLHSVLMVNDGSYE